MRAPLDLKKTNIVIGALLTGVLLMACGKERAAQTVSRVNQASVSEMQQTRSEKDFTISEASSQITVDQVKIGAQGNGEIEFSGEATALKKTYQFDLKGSIGADGMAVLHPDDASSPLRARVFCLDNDQSAHACSQYFVDVYFRKGPADFLHIQLVRQADFGTPPVPVTPSSPLAKPVAAAPVVTPAPTKAPPVAPAAHPTAPVAAAKPAPVEEAETDDAPAPDGAYVGMQDPGKIQELYAPSTASDDTGAGALSPIADNPDQPTDQAVGTYDNGHLERPSKLDETSNAYFIPAPDLRRYFGAYVTIHFIEEYLAKGVINTLPGYRLRVDDISQETGGLIYLSSGARDRRGRRIPAHASHEIGLDADIGYIMDFAHTEVPLAVAHGKMSPHVRKPLQWQMFKMIHRSALVSTVFVDPAVKHGFCAYAKAQGELQKEAATLTMLRPLDSHQTHFHLRFMCTKFNPRCRDEKVAGRPLGC